VPLGIIYYLGKKAAIAPGNAESQPVMYKFDFSFDPHSSPILAGLLQA